MTKIAILCTSATTFGKSAEKKPTGVWLEEIAVPYYSMMEKKFSVDFFSVKGGEIPVDGGSRGEGFYTPECVKFDKDDTAQALMKTSKG